MNCEPLAFCDRLPSPIYPSSAMNTKVLLLAATAALAAACSQEKTTTTDVATTPETTVTTTTTTTTVDSTAYRTAADALAERVAADLKMTDEATKARLRTIYYGRGRSLRDAEARYTADTTGRYAAIKAANDAATRDVKTTLANDGLYNTYSSGQSSYYEGPYTTVVTTEQPAKPSLGARVGQGSGVVKLERKDDGASKTKYGNDAKIKRNDDGSVKIKMADGTKIKIDEDGKRTVK